MTCWKITYKSKAQAKRSGKFRDRSRIGPRSRSLPYKCPYCGLWHLTTKGRVSG